MDDFPTTFDDAQLRVKTDLAGFASDVAQMRDTLETGLGAGADRAGRVIESSLLRAVKSGKLGFDDLKGVALSALDAIAAEALKGGIQAVVGGTGGGSGLLGALIGLLGGSPGRATGGPVSPARPYVVGERGPELFVPTTSGRIEPAVGGGAREVRVTIAVNAPAGSAPAAMAQSSRQVARAVKAALE